jgi:hypothetical protein
MDKYEWFVKLSKEELENLNDENFSYKGEEVWYCSIFEYDSIKVGYQFRMNNKGLIKVKIIPKNPFSMESYKKMELFLDKIISAMSKHRAYRLRILFDEVSIEDIQKYCKEYLKGVPSATFFK